MIKRINRYWTVRKLGPRNFVAKRRATKYGPLRDAETRFYFSEEALMRDFGIKTEDVW